MTIKELIETLSAMDPDRIVVIQKDAEGNGYSPLEGADDNCLYTADTTWSGEVGKQTLTDDDRKNGYTDDDRKNGYTDEDLGSGVPAVVLFPVN